MYTQGLEKLGEGQLSGPEDVYVDAAAGGTLYTATRDGWLQRMHPNGSWEHWRFVGGTGLLGIAPSADGSMLVCDADKVYIHVHIVRVAGSCEQSFKLFQGFSLNWREIFGRVY